MIANRTSQQYGLENGNSYVYDFFRAVIWWLDWLEQIYYLHRLW
jgi:hypothetical protein